MSEPTTEVVAYFRLMATDGCPFFEPTGHFQGSWFGVAEVKDPDEIERLRKRKCPEISLKEYGELLKKKAEPPGNSSEFRPAWAPKPAEPAARGRFDGLNVSIESADKAEPVKKPEPEKPVIPSASEIATPTKIPNRK